MTESKVSISMVLSLLLASSAARALGTYQTSQPAQADSKHRERSDSKPRSKGAVSAAASEVAERGATSTSQLAMPFKKAWEYLTDSASSLPATVDASRVYLPLAGGRIVCLERNSGSLLWSSEPGGTITVPIASSESAIYVATRKAVEGDTQAKGSLRALDKLTGLTLWVRDYSQPFTGAFVIESGRLYAGNADGSFYSIALDGGGVVWKAPTQDVVRGRALATEHFIYFGSDDGALRGVERETGREVWKFQTTGKIAGRPAADGRAIYFGSGDSYVYSVDIRTGKLIWRSRTGAAVEASAVIAGDRLLAVSFDNFVYALSRASGDRLWKRRLENRITADPIVQGDSMLIAPLRGDHVAVFLNSDGRRVNLYQLARGYEIVADPVFSDGTLLLATDKGLIVAAAKQPTNSPTNAMKKK